MGNHPPEPAVLAVTADRGQWVRENLPTCAAAAAAFAAAFPGCKLVYASENGHTIGTPGPRGMKLSELSIGSFVAVKNNRKG